MDWTKVNSGSLSRNLLAERVPIGSGLVPNVIKTKIVQDHTIPIIVLQLCRHISGHIEINLSKILYYYLSTSI